jgi:p-aminobenzoyl-glutamate transporter AbgT
MAKIISKITILMGSLVPKIVEPHLGKTDDDDDETSETNTSGY